LPKPRFAIVLPSSILNIEPTLFLKSLRIHQVARWASIFGVDRVVFYREYDMPIEEYREHREIISIHWRYFFTPPYLRKRLIPKHPLLRYVGALPPIRLQEFEVKDKPSKGEERVGYVVYEGGVFTAYLDNEEEYRVVNECKPGFFKLRVIDTEGRIAECLDKDFYLGPRLSFAGSLKEVIVDTRGRAVLIATDKKGRTPSMDDVEVLLSRGKVVFLFGSPRRDLFEISGGEGFNIADYVDAVWNTVPGQRVVSVRTEEAVIVTLGIANYLISIKTRD